MKIFSKSVESADLGRTFTSSRTCSRGLLFFALSLLLIAPETPASQSSIEQKSTYNSQKQISFSLLGTWGFDERAFADVAFTHARTPVTGVGLDTFYQLTAGGGYAVENLGFDLGLTYSQAPLTKITSFGGYLGITYIFVTEISDPNEPSDQTSLLHSQTYTHTEKLPPVFWARFGYAANAMSSGLLSDSQSAGKEAILTLDGNYLILDSLVTSAGVAIHNYDDSQGFYTNSLRNTSTSYLNLLGSTLQGLPKATFSLQATWQLAPKDALIPRYQFTEVESTRHWAHTIDLGWRHQFSKSLFMTPIYEVSMQDDLTFTGFIFSLLYAF